MPIAWTHISPGWIPRVAPNLACRGRVVVERLTLCFQNPLTIGVATESNGAA